MVVVDRQTTVLFSRRRLWFLLPKHSTAPLSLSRVGGPIRSDRPTIPTHTPVCSCSSSALCKTTKRERERERVQFVRSFVRHYENVRSYYRIYPRNKRSHILYTVYYVNISSYILLLSFLTFCSLCCEYCSNEGRIEALA